VERQVVVDEADAQMIGIPTADLLTEGQEFIRRLGQAIAAEQNIRVDVVGSEEVAHHAPSHAGGPLPTRSLALGAAVASV
jgi:hypothetical protein